MSLAANRKQARQHAPEWFLSLNAERPNFTHWGQDAMKTKSRFTSKMHGSTWDMLAHLNGKVYSVSVSDNGYLTLTLGNFCADSFRGSQMTPWGVVVWSSSQAPTDNRDWVALTGESLIRKATKYGHVCPYRRRYRCKDAINAAGYGASVYEYTVDGSVERFISRDGWESHGFSVQDGWIPVRLPDGRAIEGSTVRAIDPDSPIDSRLCRAFMRA